MSRCLRRLGPFITKALETMSACTRLNSPPWTANGSEVIVPMGTDRQILFITGFLSKRWGNKSKALAQWCQEKGWGFCCYDVRGFGDSEGQFTDYTLSDWIADARDSAEVH